MVKKQDGQIFGPDGQLLSYTDHRKAMWYVTRGLATLDNEDPYKITLKFIPRGHQKENKSMFDDNLFLKRKLSECVICGKTSEIPFNIIPTIYSRHLPDSIKSHKHDVVMLCKPCHINASRR